MHSLLWLRLSLLLAYATAILFTNPVYIPNQETLVQSPMATGDAATPMPGIDDHIVLAFDRDVVSVFSSDNKTRVHGAQRASLNCTALVGQHPETLTELHLDWKQHPITINKTSYENFPGFAGRHVFAGQLSGIDETGVPFAGFATVTWNDACDPKLFHLSAVLNTDKTHTKVLKSMPCTGANDVPNCVWISKIHTETKDELEQHHRRLMPQPDPSLPTPDWLRNRRLDSGYIITVMYMYTPTVRAAYGDEKLKSMLTAAIVTANQALQQSGVGLTFELVGIFPIDGYDTNNHQQTLDDLNNQRVPGVVQRRNEYKADIVEVFIDDSSYCGLGNLLTNWDAGFAQYAYATVYIQCISNLSHIHEAGHILGAQHDSDNAAAASGTAWAWAYGQKYCGNAGDWRTIMSYSCNSSTRIPYFSNPDVSYQGRATGVAGKADNAKVLRWTKESVSKYQNNDN